MAATQTYEERKNHFLERLSKLYSDYELISEFVDGDTFITLKYKNGYIWKTKPRYLDGKRQCIEIAKKDSKKSIKKHNIDSYSEIFYKQFSKEEYKILSRELNGLYDTITILHSKCNKSFDITAKYMIHNNKGCPYCYGKSKLSIETYQERFNIKGLSDYKILSIESKKGHIYGKIKHNCDLCSNAEFTIRLSDMLSVHNQKCPKCALLKKESYASQEIESYLIKNHIKYEKEKTFEGCKFKSKLRFDFYLPDYDLIIEYDGIQHFKPREFWGGEEGLKITQKRDKCKNDWCIKNNKDILRIKYNQNHIAVLEKYLNENYELVNECQ